MSTKCSEHWARDKKTNQRIHIYFDYEDYGYHLEFFDGKRNHHFKISKELSNNLRTERELYFGRLFLRKKGKEKIKLKKDFIDWLEQTAIEDQI